MRCKINDLAFIHKAIRQQNVGLIVQCTSLLGPMKKDESFIWNGERWYATDTGVFWEITSSSNSLETQYGKSRHAFISDAWLTPIKPLPEEDTIVTEKTLETELQS